MGCEHLKNDLGLFEFEEFGTCSNLCTLTHVNFLDLSGPGGMDFVFHLHGLEHEDGVARADRIAFLYQNAENDTGHRGHDHAVGRCL